jgi:8-oxo-dGTP diphosphatase
MLPARRFLHLESGMPAGKYVYEYPRPAVSVDVVIVTCEAKPRVLLIRRGKGPFKGCWAIPGGFVNMDEALDVAAKRELFEETGVSTKHLMQLHTFGDPKRDPRGRNISVTYLAFVDADNLQPRAGDDAAEVGWFSLRRPPKLAFDHHEILAVARKYLKEHHV